MGSSEIPVIAIDGPTASGKGTVAERVAAALGWQYLDSGALYRIVALQALEAGIGGGATGALATLARSIRPEFSSGRVRISGRDITDAIRREEVGVMASKIAVLPEVRSALLELQRGFRRPPGLVADGRDMGTVVFPDAQLKVFLTASAEARADRRYKQLIEKGFSSNLSALVQDLKQRDERDSQRRTAPMKPAQDAIELDSSDLTIDQVVEKVLQFHRGTTLKRRPTGPT